VSAAGVTRLARDGYDEVYRVECGSTVAFVALHAVIAGRAFGGVRIARYPNEEHALADALALARTMSRKVVSSGLRGGGGKAVLMPPTGGHSGRSEAIRALGTFIESLGGRYWTGPDLGFGAGDGRDLAASTAYVACKGLAGATARSVEIAMRAACTLAPPLGRNPCASDGSRSSSRLARTLESSGPQTAVVQGLGAIGRPLAVSLREAGVSVKASDVRPGACEGFASLAPGAVYDAPCDVFAPCAMGGVLDRATIERLRCRVVCGGANNPLADPSCAERLHRRGIVYVPDFIANCGATIEGASRVIEAALPASELQRTIDARLEAVGDLTREVLAEARARDRSPHDVAVERADRRIAELRSGA
jgi:leucine dehydrogenase